MLLSKRKSKKLASDIAAKYRGKMQKCNATFGAFSTCHYEVKFKYKDMRLEIYPFVPYCHIWVQNFKLKQDIHFSIGVALSALRLDVPLENCFTNLNTLIFTNDAYDINATKKFCQIKENETGIDDIQLGKGEFLIISNGQIVLQNKNHNIKSLEDRINILAKIHERNRS